MEIRPDAVFLHRGHAFQALGGPTPVPMAWHLELSVADLESGDFCTLILSRGTNVEPIRLDERSLRYLYAARDFHVLYAAEQNEEFKVPIRRCDVGIPSTQPGEAVIAGFWGQRPVTFRTQSADQRAEKLRG